MTDKQRQHLLGFLGYYVGIPDDIWGTLSKTACKAFQQDYGIKDDGFGGAETDKALLEAVYKGMPDKDINIPTTGNTELDDLFSGIRYWNDEEFRCQCNGRYCNGFPALPDRTLLELLDDIRHKAGRPGHRSSGLRCETWNVIQKGAANSKHKIGKAFDFWIEGLTGQQLLALCQADPRTSYAYIIIPGEPYVHVDVK